MYTCTKCLERFKTHSNKSSDLVASERLKTQGYKLGDLVEQVVSSHKETICTEEISLCVGGSNLRESVPGSPGEGEAGRCVQQSYAGSAGRGGCSCSLPLRTTPGYTTH